MLKYILSSNAKSIQHTIRTYCVYIWNFFTFFSFFGKSEEKSQKQRLSHNSYNKNHIREWDLILTDKLIGNHLYWHSFSFVLFDVSHSMRNDDESGFYRLNIFRVLQTPIYTHLWFNSDQRSIVHQFMVLDICVRILYSFWILYHLFHSVLSISKIVF